MNFQLGLLNLAVWAARSAGQIYELNSCRRLDLCAVSNKGASKLGTNPSAPAQLKVMMR